MHLVDVYRSGVVIPGALEFLYWLVAQRLEEPVGNISHSKMPTATEHRAFVEGRPFIHWFLIEVEGEWVGYISSTDRNEIGIVILKDHRGHGYATEAIKELLAYYPPLPAAPSVRLGQYIANINPGNSASIALFSGLGFKHIQQTYASS